MNLFGVFRARGGEAPARKRFPWLIVAIMLIPVAFYVGGRVQAAHDYEPAAEVPISTFYLDCRTDGSFELRILNAVEMGAYMDRALRIAAGKVCSRHGT